MLTLNKPNGISVDRWKTFLLQIITNNIIRKIDQSGNVTTLLEVELRGSVKWNQELKQQVLINHMVLLADLHG